MINPKPSDLCGNCSKDDKCFCDCHKKDVYSSYHEHIYSMIGEVIVRDEGRSPKHVLDLLDEINQ